MGCNASRAADVDDFRHPRITSVRFNLSRITRNGIDVSNDADNLHILTHRMSNRHPELSAVARRRRMEEVNRLRSEMRALERMFNSLIDQDYISNNVIYDNQNSRSGSCPPASQDAIENIPTIVVSDIDFEDDCNRECSICFLEFNVNDIVARLPCGHFYHCECINEWLGKKCTCPMCRWEVETEDRMFEVERVERMKARRIRVKDHELERLCIGGLQEIAGTRDINNRALLIQTIEGLNHVDIITKEKTDSEEMEKAIKDQFT